MVFSLAAPLNTHNWVSFEEAETEFSKVSLPASTACQIQHQYRYVQKRHLGLLFVGILENQSTGIER